MGVQVILDIDPSGITQSDWAGVYRTSLQLLEHWQPRLLGWRLRAFRNLQVPVYGRSHLHADGSGWSIVGDRESLRTASLQTMYKDLRHYQNFQKHPYTTKDILLTVATPTPHAHTLVRVFEDSTKGYPYHYALLAVAMLVEHLLPGRALVSGDIDALQSQVAQAHIASVLGQSIPLPVRVDANALATRLQPYFQLTERPLTFRQLYLSGTYSPYETTLTLYKDGSGRADWLRSLSHNQAADTLEVIHLLTAWLNTNNSLEEACQLACFDRRGPQFAPRDFVEALASTWYVLPHYLRNSFITLMDPKGGLNSPENVFGTFALDHKATGRHMRVRGELPEVYKILTKVFGSQAPDLQKQLFDRTQEITTHLKEDIALLRAAWATRQASLRDAPTETLKISSLPEHLSPSLVTRLHEITYRILNANIELHNDPQFTPILADQAKAKTLLTRLIEANGPQLTEDAWDAILAEESPKVLSWWIALQSLRIRSPETMHIRRILFENAKLRNYAMTLSEDKELMTRIEQTKPRQED